MALVLNCLFTDGFVTIALYIQPLKNDAILISRIIIEKTFPYFKRKAVLLQLNGYT